MTGKSSNTHTIKVRVRYAETDQMGVVYYANYLVWFEVARTGYFRERGLDYRKLEEEDHLYLPVVESYCRYKAPLRYDDMAEVTAKLTDISHTRITFEYEVRKKGKVTTAGKTKHVFVNRKGTPVPVPDKVKKAFK